MALVVATHRAMRHVVAVDGATTAFPLIELFHYRLASSFFLHQALLLYNVMHNNESLIRLLLAVIIMILTF